MAADSQILDGMEVYDIEGAKIGHVVRYDKTLGYFETQGVLTGPRFIPFSAVERVGPSGAYLNVTKSIVSQVYDHLPAVTPDVTLEGKVKGGKVASGRTGEMVPLDAEGLSLVKEEIRRGTPVLDVDHKTLGSVEAYDAESGYMRIEKGGLTLKELYLPVTSVCFLDYEGIHLAEKKDTIMNRYRRMPEVARAFFSR
jgi:hypothetical protein